MVKISGSDGTKSGSCGASMGADRARQRIAEQSQGTDGCQISQRKLKHPLPQVFRDARWDDGPVETVQTSFKTSVSDQTTKVCHRDIENAISQIFHINLVKIKLVCISLPPAIALQTCANRLQIVALLLTSSDQMGAFASPIYWSDLCQPTFIPVY